MNQASPPVVLDELRMARGISRRVEIYLQACREIQYERPHEALDYALKAQKEARKGRLKEREVHALRMGGICQYAAHDYEGALSTFTTAHDRYMRLKDRSGLARCQQNIGLALRGLGRNEEALKFYRMSEQSLRVLQDDSILMHVLINIGSTSTALNQPSSALQAYSECLAISERLDDRPMRARVMGNIADVYINIDDNERGIEWSRRSLELHRINNDQMGVGFTLTSLGRVYRSMSDHDSALAHYTESIAVMSQAGYAEGKAKSMLYLSQLYLESGLYTQAWEFADQARGIFVETHDVDSEVSALITLGEVELRRKKYPSAGRIFKEAAKAGKRTDNYAQHFEVERNHAVLAIHDERWEVAIRHLKAALSIASTNATLNGEAEAHRLLADVYERTKVHTKALHHLRKWHECKLKADGQIHARHSQALQLRLEVERAERERQVVQMQNERLQFDLVSKTRELNTSAMAVAQKNELLTTIADEVRTILEMPPAQRTNPLKDLLRRIESHKRTGEDWRNLNEQLHDVHDAFFRELTTLCPALTPSELKTASLLKLNLSSKEIADILTVSVASVEIYRHRLRRKLQIPHGTGLTAFFQQIGTGEK